MFYVYVIFSPSTGLYYKGFTTQPEQRLQEHNSGRSHYTSNKGPWELVYLESFELKRDALIREKLLKRYNTESLKRLIEQYKNNAG